MDNERISYLSVSFEARVPLPVQGFPKISIRREGLTSLGVDSEFARFM